MCSPPCSTNTYHKSAGIATETFLETSVRFCTYSCESDTGLEIDRDMSIGDGFELLIAEKQRLK